MRPARSGARLDRADIEDKRARLTSRCRGDAARKSRALRSIRACAWAFRLYLRLDILVGAALPGQPAALASWWSTAAGRSTYFGVFGRLDRVNRFGSFDSLGLLGDRRSSFRRQGQAPGDARVSGCGYQNHRGNQNVFAHVKSL